MTVHIHAHTFETPQGVVPCWTYASDGLWALGQEEFVFSVGRDSEPVGEVPLAPISFVQTLHQLASAGHFVRVGALTQFAKEGLLGFMGLLYLKLESLLSIPLPEYALTAIGVTEGELQVAQRCGCTRIAARLGQRYRYPPWKKRQPWVSPPS